MSEKADSIERIAADILIAAISSSGKEAGMTRLHEKSNAERLAEAYQIIHRAVLKAYRERTIVSG